MAVAPSTNGPARQAFAITGDDDTDLPTTTRGIYVGGAGDVAVILEGDTAAVTLIALAAGLVHPFAVKRVKVTGTTATGIVGVA